jgi:hypothetical protein
MKFYLEPAWCGYRKLAAAQREKKMKRRDTERAEKN